LVNQAGEAFMGSTFGMEPIAAAEVAFLNLGYFDATRFYWDPWAQKNKLQGCFKMFAATLTLRRV
jgi:hypothetical protein